MNLKIKSVYLENFMSFSSAELELDDLGYVLLSGVNQNPVDAARSNGAGKSTIFEAISWALTGETIRGTKQVTRVGGDDGALVKLTFSSDGKDYEVIRAKDHSKYKTTLKIFINGEDKSGKGIRDTEVLLKEYLPDITPQLLGSVIILGQGLPMRFTNNTPAGRKEVLENLSRSDFMIEDLKSRVSERKGKLQSDYQECCDKIISLKGERKAREDFINRWALDLSSIQDVEELTAEMSVCEESLSSEEHHLSEISAMRSALWEESSPKSSELNSIYEKWRTDERLLAEKWDEVINNESKSVESLRSDIRVLTKTIRDKESITDVCPTCGQKLQGVELPDTTKDKEELLSMQSKLQGMEDNLSLTKNKKRDEITTLQQEVLASTKEISDYINSSNQTIKEYDSDLSSTKDRISKAREKIESLRNKILTVESEKLSLQKSIDDGHAQINKIDENIMYYERDKESVSNHIDVINKMGTALTREFRGFLLKNIISYIDRKAKDYSKVVFDNEEVSFSLDGNNIQIAYNGKEYENLSGGEKQKIDIIIQLSVRDMMCKYLNFSCNLIALDELFDNCDEIGCQKLLSLLASTLSDTDSIFIITHHSDISIPYDKEVVVIKDESGVSRIL